MGSGGSRFGAGRPGWRRKCEHLLALDVRVLARRGRLAPGMSYSWAWLRGGEPAGNISVHTGSDHVRLAYTWTPHGSDPQQVDCSVRLRANALPLRRLSDLVQVSALLGAACGHLRRSE